MEDPKLRPWKTMVPGMVTTVSPDPVLVRLIAAAEEIVLKGMEYTKVEPGGIVDASATFLKAQYARCLEQPPGYTIEGKEAKL